MPTDELAASFIKGESLPVAVADITSELAGLWQAVADSKDESVRSATRVCKLNLIVYSPHEGAYERAAGALADIGRIHPSRVIAVLAEREAEVDELATYVKAHCHQPAPNEKQVCCEQITAVAKGSAVDKLWEIMAPLVLKELPVALWWQDDLPEDDALFEQLLKLSQRLIFDSADSHDVGNMLARARALSLNWQAGSCGDLNWQRLTQCRDLVAQFLESPEAVPWLKHIEKINLEVAMALEGDSHFAQPFLFLGWLAGLLNWRLTEPLTPLTGDDATSEKPATSGESSAGRDFSGASVFRTNWQNKNNSPTGSVGEIVGTITLHHPAPALDDAAMPVGMLSVQLQFREEAERLCFFLRRDPNQGQVIMKVTKGEKVLTESAMPLSEASLAELAIRELNRTGHDQIYESALRIATQLI
ncbi:MAG: glucose-6-phosphate dehydrogenase assembly protein OpcA [candidate division KSB1 bacterium]|nr:glucose-6-phosphate dehydrogenase assembly protein OpcA [candidate division KSB1 bacterium]MDZ7312883.1 glucose-6-phosphate dehydrogenase assembly protein OpcA [candidate division KSB1 bacterium]